MTKTLLIPGLPPALARDGWWLDASAPKAPTGAIAALPAFPRWAGLFVLVVLADWLFWHQRIGLSLALFAVAIVAVASVDMRPRHGVWRPLALLLIAIAPVVEHLQVLSVSLMILGGAGSLILMRRGEPDPAKLLAQALALPCRLPGRWLASVSLRKVKILGAFQTTRGRGTWRRLLREWAFPAGGGLILVGLLMQANPVLAGALRLDLDLWTMLSRGLFWIGAGVFVAPLLAPDLTEPVDLPGALTVPLGRLGLNPASVLRALVVFNMLIGVQTATDSSILLFGAALPEGMSMAEYAHRGAYPLLATAILAGAFALGARPFLGEHRAIKPLLLLWLLQNMAMCGAAMLRLDHYVDAFGLTYLRLYAAIWMGLVAAGLGLVTVQVLFTRPNLWLLTRCSALGLAVLYVCSFVNFAHIIAAQNLARPSFDAGYVCNLGPAAHGALHSASGTLPKLRNQYPPCAILSPPVVEGWRDWGFRSWRVNRYAASAGLEDSQE